MDKDILKSLLYEYWYYLVIAVLCFLLLKSCTGGKELRLANDELKTEVKELILSSDKYVAKNNELSSKILLLEKLKAKVKTEIVYIENKTKSDLKKVPTLNTKQIGNYYQERYKLPVTLTQYGVSLSDTLAKKNITELIEKDGCFAEVKLFKVQLQLEEKKGIVKDTIIGNFKRANVDLNKAIFAEKKIIINTENSLKKEKNKKTFWQVTSGAILIGAGYLLIK
jgi:hypothetical protein